MNKEVSFKYRDKFIQLGLAISTLRRISGMTQEQLAEKANISRSLVSKIEGNGTAIGFSLEVLFDISEALDVDPSDLINSVNFIKTLSGKG